jgi:GWxTD domain-containing protein
MRKIHPGIPVLFIAPIVFGFLLQASPPKTGASEKGDVPKLAAQYQDWLDLVSYIITPTEKEVFSKLSSDRERDAFISLFWNLRDPSKGTPQNEFKDEHIKRFRYANQYFKYGTPKPGWKTDRGKIHIILGPPLSKNEILENGLRPVEIWDYMGGPSKGLPTSFRIVFYKPSSSDDYKFYIPAVDGPHSLLVGPDKPMDPLDYANIYQKIRQIEPAVAEIALSLIPGETMWSSSPSLQDPLLMARIADLPKSNINSTYAKNFLNYKGFVEVRATTNYVDMNSEAFILKDPRLNLYFVHLALEPDRVSVEQLADGRYYFNYKLTITLKKGDHFVLQYDKDFSVYMTQSELDNTLSQGVIIADHFPLIEGEYKLTAVLRNSVNDEISFMERAVKLEEGDPSAPRISDPIISYGVGSGGETGFAPFRIMGQNIKIDPKQTFSLKDIITPFFLIERRDAKGDVRIKLEIESLNPAKPFFKDYGLVIPQADSFPFFSKTLDPLPAGDYLLRGKLLGPNDAVLDAREKIFHVSLNAQVPHPALVSKGFKNKDLFYFYYVAATEYDEMKRNPQAEAYFKKAIDANPFQADLIKSYAGFLLKQGRDDDALSVIENLKTQAQEAFSYFSLKGRALFHKKEYHAAVETLLEANKIYDSDIVVLNTLGLALIQIGEKDEAIKVLTASLKLQKDQPDIRKVLLQLENK